MPPVNRLTDSEKWNLLDSEKQAAEQKKAEASAGPRDLGVSYMAEVVSQLLSDAAADLLRKLPKEFSDSVVASLPDGRSSGLREILGQPEGSAGSFMAKEFLYVPEGGTIAEAVDALHNLPQHQKGRIPYVYVLDPQGRPSGVLQTKDLIFHSPETPVDEVASSPVVTVTRATPQKELISIFQDRRFLAVPVVDDAGVLTGVVTADNMLQAVRDEADRAIAHVVGTDPEEHKTQSVPRILRLRLPWLSVNMASGLLCAFISGAFEHGAQIMTTLLLFIPVVLGLSESTGIQGATIVVRNLTLGKAPLKNFSSLFVRELSVGVLIGTVCGLVVGAVSSLWQGNATLGLAIGLSLSIAIAVSAAVGLLLPVLFRALRIDPATASGPLVLALCDIQTLLLYFNIAGFILRS